MRISSARIENFRAIEDVTCAFDDVTTFIGPNGAGKSSILRALDWLFNGAKGALGDQDRYSLAAVGSRIRVRVDFDGLTQADRDALGEKYAPASVDTFTAWRTIEESGEEKITAKAMAFLPFETVRAAVGVPDKKAALALARSQHPDLDLPSWTTIAGTGAAMDEWERQHPEALTESEVSDTHFFGFYGQGKLSGIFDFVFVSADLRAGEESQDTRDSITGRILQRAIDREPFSQAVSALVAEFTERHHKLGVEYLDEQLGVLADELTEEVGRFTKGRSVVLAPGEMDLRPQPPRIALSIRDGGITTPVTSQGHGFQRTLLIAALDILARHGTAKAETGTICLAIEEPELFQHPTQAKAFASVLRSLATNPNDRVQVMYATHSPYFVEPTYFDNVRRVVREATLGGPPAVRVMQASMEVVADRLEHFDSRSGNDTLIWPHRGGLIWPRLRHAGVVVTV